MKFNRQVTGLSGHSMIANILFVLFEFVNLMNGNFLFFKKKASISSWFAFTLAVIVVNNVNYHLKIYGINEMSCFIKNVTHCNIILFTLTSITYERFNILLCFTFFFLSLSLPHDGKLNRKFLWAHCLLWYNMNCTKENAKKKIQLTSWCT